VSKPFTITGVVPASYKALGPANQVTGYSASVPRNKTSVITRKGLEVNSVGQVAVAVVRTVIEVPAGADVQSPAELRAMMSAHIGALSDTSSGIGDLLVDGVL
jgi:hypothetical protein